jgi:hypothetical protein
MAGYSGTLLVKKPGIKDWAKPFLVNPSEGYFTLLTPLPAGAHVRRV